MTARVAVVVAVAVTAFLGALGAVGIAQVLQLCRAREEHSLRLIDARRERLRPSVERLLRAGISS